MIDYSSGAILLPLDACINWIANCIQKIKQSCAHAQILERAKTLLWKTSLGDSITSRQYYRLQSSATIIWQRKWWKNSDENIHHGEDLDWGNLSKSTQFNWRQWRLMKMEYYRQYQITVWCMSWKTKDTNHQHSTDGNCKPRRTNEQLWNKVSLKQESIHKNASRTRFCSWQTHSSHWYQPTNEINRKEVQISSHQLHHKSAIGYSITLYREVSETNK